jgi:hypothetical protein
MAQFPGQEASPEVSLSLVELSKARRELAHDLSNALEIIMQTSFLLGTLDLGDNGKTWHKLLDDGVQKAVAINQKLRESLRADPGNTPA